MPSKFLDEFWYLVNEWRVAETPEGLAEAQRKLESFVLDAVDTAMTAQHKAAAREIRNVSTLLQSMYGRLGVGAVYDTMEDYAKSLEDKKD